MTVTSEHVNERREVMVVELDYGLTGMLGMGVDAGSGVTHRECVPEEWCTCRLLESLTISARRFALPWPRGPSGPSQVWETYCRLRYSKEISL